MIRMALLVIGAAMLWSSVWFQPNGITIMFPGLGGYHFSYADF